jgi:phosphopantothenoylcysteine decarboxylase/phosphopantothenate--cysteine ligase
MASAVEAVAGTADIAILCAAVCDFRPAASATSKLKKTDRDHLEVELVRTADILAALGGQSSRPFLVGFAAESDRLRERAEEKMTRKNCDMIVGNLIGGAGVGMGGEDNEVLVLDRAGGVTEIERASKAEVAARVWRAIVETRRQLAP